MRDPADKKEYIEWMLKGLATDMILMIESMPMHWSGAEIYELMFKIAELRRPGFAGQRMIEYKHELKEVMKDVIRKEVM